MYSRESSSQLCTAIVKYTWPKKSLPLLYMETRLGQLPYHKAFNLANNFSASLSSSSICCLLPRLPELWLVKLEVSVKVSSIVMSRVTEFSNWKRFDLDLDLASWARRSAEKTKQKKISIISVNIFNLIRWFLYLFTEKKWNSQVNQFCRIYKHLINHTYFTYLI